MSKEILIHIQASDRRVAIIEDGKIDDFFIEVERYQPILGNIYKGKVESILPSINGAFVDIGQERNGFLYLTDAISPLMEEEISGPRKFLEKLFHSKSSKDNPQDPQEGSKDNPKEHPKEGHERHDRRHHHHEHNKPAPLTKGQEILVQVVKEPFGNKGARLTTHISLPGRFVVYMPYDKQGGVSRKIDDLDERHRLRDVLKEFTFARTGGFIVRTASLKQGKGELVRDAKFLSKIWHRIKKLSDEKKAPALIYKEYDLVWKVVRDLLTDNVDRLFIDSEEDFHKMRKFVNTLIGRHMVGKIHLYKDPVPLFQAKNVSHELEKIYDPKVFLKSGAYIVIEPTEALTVVDVNSGKFKVKASPEDAAFMVNMEAAPEIARQLRLRDLGGIIVIDFIDMGRDDHKRKVIAALEDALSKDHSKTEVNRISPLGLVEMTRARTGKTIESMTFEPCPYCDGRGKVRIV